MSRFDPPEPGPAPKRKNDDSIQGGPFKMNRFGHGDVNLTGGVTTTRAKPVRRYTQVSWMIPSQPYMQVGVSFYNVQTCTKTQK